MFRDPTCWTPIGCAVTAAAWLLQITRTGDRLIATRSQRCSPGEQLDGADAAGALRDAYSRCAFRGRRAVGCVSAEELACRRMRLAPMPERDLTRTIYWQIAREIGREPLDLCTDYYEVGHVQEGGKSRCEVLAVSAPKARLAGQARSMREAGLLPVAIDTTAGALARCLAAGDTSGQRQPRLVVSFGARTALIVVVLAGTPRFIHAVTPAPAPGGDSRDRMAGPPSESHVADVGSAVQRCAHYLAERYSGSLLPRIGCVVGAGPDESAVAGALARATRIDFHPVIDAVAVRVRALLSQLPDESPLDQWLVPLGLAMYGRERALIRDAA